MNSIKDEFLDILTSYQGILHKVNLIYFRCKADRDDNFQEIVYQLWKSFPNLKNKESIGSWIYAVAINTSINRIKKEGRTIYTNQLPDSLIQNDDYSNLMQEEETRILIEAIQKLNEIDKSIMLLYLDGLSYNEIAGIIGISASNVGVRISRAKEMLKKILKD
jgi:RNA polymerase sigma-70 factor (ECF subfamily)